MAMNMKVTDMALAEAEPTPQVEYQRLYALLPKHTVDAGWVWFEHVWHVSSEGEGFYVKGVLPLGVDVGFSK